MRSKSHAALLVMLLATGAATALPALSAPRQVRAGAAASVHRNAAAGPAGRQAGPRAQANINRSGNRAAVANRSGNRINTGDVNIGNDVNINVDNDHGWDWDDHRHPVAAGIAFGTAAAVTSAVVGSMIYSLPPACSPYPYRGMSYYSCGGVYYEPQYQGDKVVYVVVERP